MIDATARCRRGRAWPSRSRMQGATRARGTRATEDDEMRRATRIIRWYGVVASVISFTNRPPHDLDRGALSGPDAKRGGALANQDLEPIDDGGAGRSRGAAQLRLVGPVGEVHQYVSLAHRIGIQRQALEAWSAFAGPTHANRGRVDDQVEGIDAQRRAGSAAALSPCRLRHRSPHLRREPLR